MFGQGLIAPREPTATLQMQPSPSLMLQPP